MTMIATRTPRWTGLAAMLGGLAWIGFWSLHTLAHGPDNPAPTTYTVLGHTADDWGTLMLRTATIPLIVGLLGLTHRYGRRLGRLGFVGAVVALVGLLMLLAAGLGISGWMLYMLGAAVTSVGLILFGLAALRGGVLPWWRRGLPLLMGGLPPLIDVVRQPGSPLLEQSDLVGYLLLERYGVVFGVGWLLLGYTLWMVRPSDSSP